MHGQSDAGRMSRDVVVRLRYHCGRLYWLRPTCAAEMEAGEAVNPLALPTCSVHSIFGFGRLPVIVSLTLQGQVTSHTWKADRFGALDRLI